MPDRMRVVVLATRLAVKAGGWRVLVILLCCLSLAIQPSANALALKFLTNGVLTRDWGQAAAGIGVLVVLIAVMFSAYGIWVPLETTVSEKAACLFEQDVMRLVDSIPTLEAHERPEFVDHLETLRGDSRLLIGALWTAFSNLSFFVGAGAALGLLGSVDPVLLLLPVCGLPLFAASLFGGRLKERATDHVAEPLRAATHLFRIATTPAYGMELRAFRLMSEVKRRHGVMRAGANRKLFGADLRAGLLSSGAWAIFLLGWTVGVVRVAEQAVRGEVTVGDVVLTLAVAGVVQGYVSGAVNVTRDLHQTLSTATRYLWLVDFAGRISAGTRLAPHDVGSGITFQRVSFAYPGTDTEVLTDLSVTLPRGATIGIVGENGAGKTTFIKLLLGLYRPTSGRILVDGQDLADLRPDDWRSRTAGAFQDYTKFEFRLAESVGVGELPRLTDTETVRGAIVKAGATGLPDIAQQLGARWDDGVDLSGGQWQQVAVSRGMMRDAPLVRVLDEPTAALDADKEHDLFERYREAAHGGPDDGTVTLLVSHRFSTVHMTDLILVFADGAIIERGTHQDLLARGGAYAELFSLQARAYR